MIRKFKNNFSSPSLLKDFIDTSEEIVLVQDRFTSQSQETKRKQIDNYDSAESNPKAKKAQVAAVESLASKLVQAARVGDFNTFHTLLDNKVDVNAVICNWTALLYASFYGRVEMIEALLKAGADVNKTSSNGTTPLMCAVEQNKIEAVKVLLNEPSLKIDAVDNMGETALFKSIKAKLLPMVEILVDEGGADLNFVPAKENITVSGKGNAALHEAVLRGYEDGVRHLLECGADVNLLCKGATPLHRAVSKDNIAIVKCLLDWEADVTIEDSLTERTVVHLACFYNQFEVVKTLVENGKCGSMVYSKDKYSKTPRDVASQKGLLQIVQFLEEYEKAHPSATASNVNYDEDEDAPDPDLIDE